MEQGMVVGGLGSVAFLEALGFAQSFLQAKLEHIWGTHPDTTPHLTRVDARYGNMLGVDDWPMVAREGVVGGMLLTKNGIFYLRTKDLLLYRSIATRETRDIAGLTQAYAASKLSYHALELYNKMLDEYAVSGKQGPDFLEKKNKEDKVTLMHDCLLHMLLNDFAVALSYVKPHKADYKKEIVAMLALIQKVTLRTPSPSQGTLSILGMGSTRRETLIEKTSRQCLEEWTREHEGAIKDDILNLFSEIKDKKLFFRGDINAWQSSSPENSQNAQWKHSYGKHGLDFNQKVGCINTELESFNAPMRSSDSWERIGRLRYCINAQS